jgi:CBS domain containing-hemolysin-like protein
MTAALLLLAVGLIAANGFFVGAEFAVLASRRARLEPLLRSSRRARTALRSIEQLPLMISAASSASPSPHSGWARSQNPWSPRC